MSGIFNMDSPLMRALGRLADLMILNLLFLLCCIPIFTIGDALTAMNYVALKMHDGEEGYVSRSFFKSFKQNFKQATLMWLITLLVVFVLVCDLMILRSAEGAFYFVLTVIIIVICIVCLMIFLYQFAVLSKFENSIKNTFKNSFIMAVADFPRTILMALVIAAALIITFFNGTTLSWAILFWFLVGFSTITYINTNFIGKVFKKYLPKEEEEEKSPDYWDVDETMGPKEKSIEDIESETPGVEEPAVEGPAVEELTVDGTAAEQIPGENTDTDL